jgi:hypothetical protein
MATGYTTIIGEREDLTFKEFTLRCARAFGACVMQRDDDLKQPPKKLEVESYHLDSFNEAERNLKKFKVISKKDLQIQFKSDQEKSDREWQKSKKESDKLKSKYVSMLDKVKAWNPPTNGHVGLKTFMIQQLEDSIKWDCTDSKRDNTSFQEWYKAQLEHLEWEVNYHQQEYVKEVGRVKDQNLWIENLYESI